MDYEKLNPCARQWYVWLSQWAETGCWCCTTTRALLVGLCAGAVVGLAAGGAWKAALIAGAIMAPLIVALLAVARHVWRESYAKDTEEPK